MSQQTPTACPGAPAAAAAEQQGNQSRLEKDSCYNDWWQQLPQHALEHLQQQQRQGQQVQPWSIAVAHLFQDQETTSV
jgi:hypothetical protein